MKLAKDFKEFLLRGNIVDLAVAVVIGVAFGANLAGTISASVLQGWKLAPVR